MSARHLNESRTQEAGHKNLQVISTKAMRTDKATWRDSIGKKEGLRVISDRRFLEMDPSKESEILWWWIGGDIKYGNRKSKAEEGFIERGAVNCQMLLRSQTTGVSQLTYATWFQGLEEALIPWRPSHPIPRWMKICICVFVSFFFLFITF